jgi:hypothetical protein
MFKKIIALAALLGAVTLSTHAATPTYSSTFQIIYKPASVTGGSTFTVTLKRVISNPSIGVPNQPVDYRINGRGDWILPPGNPKTDPSGTVTFLVQAPSGHNSTFVLDVESPATQMVVNGVLSNVKRAYIGGWPMTIHLK